DITALKIISQWARWSVGPKPRNCSQEKVIVGFEYQAADWAFSVTTFVAIERFNFNARDRSDILAQSPRDDRSRPAFCSGLQLTWAGAVGVPNDGGGVADQPRPIHNDGEANYGEASCPVLNAKS
ncbi:MAG: hypothetical protein Q8N17_03915, partial [Burkholderiaceae bacterium]|nr:hypothetical protein [Burkholderiaceae bacterium]